MRTEKIGDATLYEKHWLWCMEENNGKYIAPEKGPYAGDIIEAESALKVDRRQPAVRRKSEVAKDAVEA